MGIYVPVKQIFVNHFSIKESQFNWHLPLDQLDADFKTLSFLVYLEQLINSKFKTKVSIIEKINASVHTPKDIVHLIEKEV
ncbi:hypothetical protein JCM19301_1332 [Jejuia pallidilutea]|jgi:hypothetical protein|uniref:Acyl carrier protein n=2 Tax=Jejuia pallidilutea TaxID=504487 RepID=A0A090W2K9_9FLAO|nr:hypothetical protein JCM19301_1332 [Jejuia pallidilutea]GAL70423.1 hypothetical protein JCM19302_3545 [Jejuia pallidilutea]GAL90495.1 hypothetical protein JCM19538_260 [Jejuia pallidilutea]